MNLYVRKYLFWNLDVFKDNALIIYFEKLHINFVLQINQILSFLNVKTLTTAPNINPNHISKT